MEALQYCYQAYRVWFRPALAIFYGSRRTAQNGENLGHVYDVMQIKTRQVTHTQTCTNSYAFQEHCFFCCCCCCFLSVFHTDLFKLKNKVIVLGSRPAVSVSELEETNHFEQPVFCSLSCNHQATTTQLSKYTTLHRWYCMLPIQCVSLARLIGQKMLSVRKEAGTLHGCDATDAQLSSLCLILSSNIMLSYVESFVFAVIIEKYIHT